MNTGEMPDNRERQTIMAKARTKAKSGKTSKSPQKGRFTGGKGGRGVPGKGGGSIGGGGGG